MLNKLFLGTALAMISACDAYAGEALAKFDVAEDHTTFAFAPAPVDADGMPAHGNPFVTQGYIYPAGTLSGTDAGVLEDGSPAYPNKVLGIWTCDGWFVGDAMATKSGTWLISRQVYEFDNGDILISQGPEIADEGKKSARAITGATGDYADNDGVIFQTLLGFNDHMGVNATFEIVNADAGDGINY